MSNLAIPSSPEEITAEWLTEAIGANVETAEAALIGVGVGVSSAVYRVQLTGDCPSSVVVKLPALDEAANFTSTMLQMYRREVYFFNELADQSPVKVPHVYHAQVTDDASNFVLVMEDIGHHRFVDQTVGFELADIERAVDALATWHAQWWGKADAIAESGGALPIDSPVYAAVLPLVFPEGWDLITAQMDLDPATLEIGPKWVEAQASMAERITSGPQTLVHGDYRADNMVFDANHELVLLDFQILGTGSGAYDLAYLVTQSLPTELAHAHERALFDRYVAGLTAAGVAESDTTDLWEVYRVSALFCLVYPVVACRGIDFDEPRSRALAETMMNAYARAVEDLNLAELI